MDRARSLTFHRNIVISSLRDCGQEWGIFLCICRNTGMCCFSGALILFLFQTRNYWCSWILTSDGKWWLGEILLKCQSWQQEWNDGLQTRWCWLEGCVRLCWHHPESLFSADRHFKFDILAKTSVFNHYLCKAGVGNLRLTPQRWYAAARSRARSSWMRKTYRSVLSSCQWVKVKLFPWTWSRSWL